MEPIPDTGEFCPHWRYIKSQYAQPSLIPEPKYSECVDLPNPQHTPNMTIELVFLWSSDISPTKHWQEPFYL